MKLSTLVLSILSLTTFLTLSASERCNPQDKKALLQIKKDLNNPYHLTSWDPATDCCSWYVVECDRSTNRINEIHLFAANISGQIPAAVADLPYLVSLTFHKITNFTGTIPPAIVKLKRLTSLTISWTGLSGPIPSFLGDLKKLTSLFLSSNQFSGPIPPTLANLRNLKELSLDRNKLTGAIPASFGNLAPSLQYLDFSHNQISGSIPRGWGNHNFSTLRFGRNRIEGDLSLLFGKNKSVDVVDFSRNALAFNLSNVVFQASLTTLDLNHNRIYGGLEGLAKLKSLYYLNVSYNRLCGRIPAGGKLQGFEYTNFFHNKCLCGKPLPECK